MRDVDFSAMQPVEFILEKGALSPKTAACPRCGRRLKLQELDAAVDSSISMRAKCFHCRTCGIRFFGLRDSSRLQRARSVAHAVEKGFALQRRLSFDGDNYTFRVPKELTRNVKKRRIHITPLGPNKFLATVE